MSGTQKTLINDKYQHQHHHHRQQSRKAAPEGTKRNKDLVHCCSIKTPYHFKILFLFYSRKDMYIFGLSVHCYSIFFLLGEALSILGFCGDLMIVREGQRLWNFARVGVPLALSLGQRLGIFRMISLGLRQKAQQLAIVAPLDPLTGSFLRTEITIVHLVPRRLLVSLPYLAMY